MAKAARPELRLWDRIVLMTAWAVTCGLVYLLGFYVGKGTQERRPGFEERVVRLPVTSTPPPEGQRPKTGAQLSFYDELLNARAGEAGAPSTPPPTTPPSAALPVVPPPLPKVAAPAVPAVPPTPPPAARPAAVAAKTPSPPAAVAAVPRPPSPPPAAAPGATPPPAAPVALGSPPATIPAPAARPAGGGWTVEANPTRSRDEAEALQNQLRHRGYDAVVTHVQRDGETWYRLRVGRYQNSEQASQVMRRLREQEGVARAFVASE